MTSWFRSCLLEVVGSATGKGPTETDLSLLLNIGTPKSSGHLRATSEWTDVILDCVAVASHAKTYSSRTVLTESVKYRSEPHKTSTIIDFRLDFVGPECFHVKQAARESGDFDEWVTLGAEHYSRPALWLRNDSGRNPMLNTFLLPSKYLHVLSTLEPSSAEKVRHLMARYLYLEYELDAANNLGAFSDFLLSYLGRAPTTCLVSVWVDQQSHRIVKGQVQLEGQMLDGSKVNFDIRQAFTNYNKEIRFDRPKIGLEPTPDKPGTYTVTDNRVYVVPFQR